MSDNLQKKRPGDSQRVNINESWEVRYWCKELGVSESKLREAVGRAGTMVSDVKKALNKS